MKNVEKLRIGDVAKKLNVEPFVIRFWEREFGIQARRSAGSQRFYSKKDFERISLIKELLYDKKFTIAGAKKYLKEHTAAPKTGKKMSITAAHRDTSEEANLTQVPVDIYPEYNLLQQLAALKEQLQKLYTLL